MTRRQTLRQTRRPLPRIWLMTDPRFGADLLLAIQRLPARSGVMFRHYELGEQERRALFARVRHICMRRGHMLLFAGNERTAMRLHAHGFHSRADRRQSKIMIQSAPVHDRYELAQARHTGADMIFLSPVFATASHPGLHSLGRNAFLALAKQSAGMRVIALGGMSVQKASTLDKHIVHGWAAIDSFRR